MCNLLWTPSLMNHCRSVNGAPQSVLLTTSQEDTVEMNEMMNVEMEKSLRSLAF